MSTTLYIIFIHGLLLTPAWLQLSNTPGCMTLYYYDSEECVYKVTCVEYIDIHRYNMFPLRSDNASCYTYYFGENRNFLQIVYKDVKENVEQSVPKVINSEAVLGLIKLLDLSDNEYTVLPSLKYMPHLSTLDISRNYLTEATFSNKNELSELKEINFSHNRINNIDANRYEYTYKELTKINMSHNYLVKLPSSVFETFPKLEYLDLSRNYIDTLSVLTFEGVKKLVYLRLSNNRIVEINISFFRFSELEELYLDHNKIETIKEADFNKLCNLRILDLSSNVIVNIERNAFENMINLKTIDLSGNSLEYIDKYTFLNASSLEHINLSENKLKLLPKELLSNKNIIDFSITGNSLTGSIVRGTFEGLNLVTELNLSNQQLTSIEDYAFFGLDKLEQLLLNNNNIESLSKKSFHTLKFLYQLNLSNNKIIHINFAKDDLISLRFLSLSDNCLYQMNDEDLLGLSELEFLNLSNNNISTLQSKSFKSLKQLINFEISNNPLKGTLEENTFEGLSSLPRLDLSLNLLDIVKNNSFTGMTNLKNLNISNSQIKILQYNAFSNTGQVEIIDLSNNRLEDFVVNTTELVNLNILLLSKNALKAISDRSFQNLPRLTKIIISHNRIENIPNEAFNDQKDLRYLDLSYNMNLKYNVSLIVKQPNLLNLFLSGIKTNVSFDNYANMPLSHLEMSYSEVRNVTVLGLKGFINLENLTLSHNEITSIEVGAFYNVSNLRILDLSFNKLTFIQPGAFKDNKLLYSLNISHNSLTAVSYGIFRGLIYLRTIDISYNQINDLQSERFYEVSSLELLIADHNNINTFSLNEFDGTSITKLSIGENPIPCKLLVNFKKQNIPFEITAINLDESNNENIDGIICKTDDVTEKNKSPSDKFGNNEILFEIKNFLFNLTNKKSDTHYVSVPNNDTYYLANISEQMAKLNVDQIDKQSFLSDVTNLTSVIVDETKKSNIIMFKILQILTANNSTSTTSTVKEKTMVEHKDNMTYDMLISYINKIKEDLENIIARDRQDVLDEVNNKLSRVDYVTVSPTSRIPRQEQLLSNNDSMQKSSVFIEVCVVLILVILCAFILYTLYKFGVFARTRHSFTSSTHQIAHAMESPNL